MMSYYYDLSSYTKARPTVFIEPKSTGPEISGDDECRSTICTCKANYSPKVKESFTFDGIAVNTASPEVNGPPAWFTYHNGSFHLPDILSPVSIKRIQGYIDGIPEMQPCLKCSEHARAYIEKNRDRIQSIKRGEDVARFFVDFHNYVNQKLGKRIVSFDEAKAMYNFGKGLTPMKY